MFQQHLLARMLYNCFMAKKSESSIKQSDPPATPSSLADRIASLKFALETAIVLAERKLLPGPALIDEWTSITNSH